MTDGGDDPDDGDGSDATDATGEAAGLPGPAAAYAKNWLTVLAVDALVGVAVLAAGLYLSVSWNPVGGGFVGSLGLVYVLLVVRRGRGWAAWRRDAGL